MLEKFNFSVCASEKLEGKTKALSLEISRLQYIAAEKKIPVVIIMEGLSASAKYYCLSFLALNLDPRTFDVYSGGDIVSNKRPLLINFSEKMPKYGETTVFCPSYYTNVALSKNFEVLQHINAFEKQLYDDGYVIIKFFMHVSAEKQAKRLKNEKKKGALFTPGHRLADTSKYDENIEAFDKILCETDTKFAKWNIIPSDDKKYARYKVFEQICKVLKERFENSPKEYSLNLGNYDILPAKKICEYNLAKSLSTEEYIEKLKKYQKKLSRLQAEIFAKKIPVVICYEGNDAAGKGGNIKRVTRALDARTYRVVSIGAPKGDEAQRQYLWRFEKELPRKGNITIFDRTWYGRALMENVENLTPKNRIAQAYGEINEFESYLAKNGVVIIKFYLIIDKDEQYARFKSREETPEKRWKITDEDWQNREKWDKYEAAANIMLERTNTSCAPWTVVESNCKRYSRIKALKTIVDTLSKYV